MHKYRFRAILKIQTASYVLRGNEPSRKASTALTTRSQKPIWPLRASDGMAGRWAKMNAKRTRRHRDDRCKGFAYAIERQALLCQIATPI